MMVLTFIPFSTDDTFVTVHWHFFHCKSQFELIVGGDEVFTVLKLLSVGISF